VKQLLVVRKEKGRLGHVHHHQDVLGVVPGRRPCAKCRVSQVPCRHVNVAVELPPDEVSSARATGDVSESFEDPPL
jgi:hypothetical protein